MNSESVFWKVVSNYIISFLVILVLLVIAWIIKYYLIGKELSRMFGIAGSVIIFASITGFLFPANINKTEERISPDKVHRWIFIVSFITGVFFSLIFFL